MTREQCKAARAILGWTQPVLTEKAGIALKTLVDFERGHTKPHSQNLEAVKQVLINEGIVFVSDEQQGTGVLLKKR